MLTITAVCADGDELSEVLVIDVLPGLKALAAVRDHNEREYRECAGYHVETLQDVPLLPRWIEIETLKIEPGQ